MASEQPSEASIFNAARQIASTDDRAVYLSEACGDDSALRERVDKLLKAFTEESQFLEKPAPGLEETIIPTSSGDDLAASLEAGLAVSFDAEAAVVIGMVISVHRRGDQVTEEVRYSILSEYLSGQQSVMAAASRHQPAQAPSVQRQHQRKATKSFMESSLPRSSPVFSLTKLHAPSGPRSTFL